MQTYQQVGEVRILPRHRLDCHCVRVELELDLPDGIVDMPTQDEIHHPADQQDQRRDRE